MNSKDSYCSSCHHFGYCEIYWGLNCKRQGGTRTPRMKSSTITKEIIEEAIEKPMIKRPRNNRSMGTDTIRTRVVAW